jgi:hypothetical protein
MDSRRRVDVAVAKKRSTLPTPSSASVDQRRRRSNAERFGSANPDRRPVRQPSPEAGWRGGPNP